MNSGKRPYRHLYCDVASELPFLAKRSCAVVFLTIGIMDGVTVNDIMAVTGLDERTVESALVPLNEKGFIKAIGGKYITAEYIEDKRTNLADTNNVSTRNVNPSINRFSNPSVNRVVSNNTEKEFSTAIQALGRVLLSYGGMNALEMQDFAELWTDYPSPERHAAALEVMLERATKPNYRYYASCVRNGATPKRGTRGESVEVVL